MLNEIETILNGEHFLSMMIILVLGFTLMSRSVLSERVHQKQFWVTLVVCMLLVFQDILERYAQLDPDRRTLRMITTTIGYVLRPVAVLGFLLVIWPPSLSRWYLWIPAGVSAAVYCTATFSPMTFSFNESYQFMRGPLWPTMFIVCMVYLILILLMIHRRFRDRRVGDLVVIYVCVIGCLGATVWDVSALGGAVTIPAILISSLTFYLFLRAQDMDHDTLTRLWNRMTFYEDCRKLKKTVTAVASIDMNGLKRINDAMGHEAGDRALMSIGRAIRSRAGRKVFGYRIGWDEFMLLFLRGEEQRAESMLKDLVKEIRGEGLSVSYGLASQLTDADASLENMLRLSDRRMYEAKSRYYMLHDRRGKR